MASTTPIWERSKENAAPLERGRNVQRLERSFAQDLEERVEKERMIQHYERLVQTIDDNNDDPLVHWLSYIKYHQDAFPSDTHTQFLLFERCVRALSPQRRYANDVRFVRLCCMYAEKTDAPSEVFQHLYQQKIGQETAIFYMAWGFVAEKQENFKFAEEIFQKGIRKKAEPVEKLVQRYRQFQRRMTRYWLNATADEEGGASTQRGVLGSLSEEAFRRNDRSSARSGGSGRQAASSRQRSNVNLSTFVDRTAVRASSQPQQQSFSSKNGTSKTAFAIFVDHQDENNESPELAEDASFVATDRVLPRQQDVRKENTMTAERWNERGALSVPTYARVERPCSAPVTPFAIHVDEECAAMHQQETDEQRRQQEMQRQHRDERTFSERRTDDIAEHLAKDPLRYMKDPSRLAQDTGLSRPAHNASASRMFQDGRDKRKQPSNKLGFSGRLLKDDSGREQCFAEERARRQAYRAADASADFNHFDVEPTKEDTSSMSLDQTIDGSTTTTGRLDLVTPRNASTASSTIDEQHAVGAPMRREEQTINTQLALKELSMMFSSPAVNDSSRVGGLNDSVGSAIVSQPIIEEGNSDDAEETADLNDIMSVLGRPAPAPVESYPAPLSFAIYEDSEAPPAHRQTATREDLQDILVSSTKVSSPPKPCFTVFEDSAPAKGPRETANPDDLQQLLLGEPSQQQATTKKEARGLSLHVASAGTQAATTPRSYDGDGGDTASLSGLGECLQTLNDELARNDSQDGLRDDPGLLSPPPFGDISQTLPTTVLKKKSIECPVYHDLHRRDVQAASREVRAQAIGAKIGGSLVQLFKNRQIIDFGSECVPSAFINDYLQHGAEVVVGKSVGCIERELGRGVYGVVALLERADDEEESIIVKIQRPEDCLAWEFQIMNRLHERAAPFATSFRFPKPMAYLALCDGAILGMTSSSTSGNTLVDLVNAYSLRDESVPENVALYYVGRMLYALEILHRHGKILHCDTKPDNWVLEPSKRVHGRVVEGADLCLIDFGRAVDLTRLGSEKFQPHDFKLQGKAVVDEMRCVAMREGRPWSYDVDMFGVCESAHAMLFQSHIEVQRGTSGIWMPVKSLKTLKYLTLWTEIFEVLLNPSSDENGVSFHLESLRLLRDSIETHLAQPSAANEVKMSLEAQSSLMTQGLRKRTTQP